MGKNIKNYDYFIYISKIDCWENFTKFVRTYFEYKP